MKKPLCDENKCKLERSIIKLKYTIALQALMRYAVEPDPEWEGKSKDPASLDAQLAIARIRKVNSFVGLVFED